MFGIKTKKDKKIEVLQREIEELLQRKIDIEKAIIYKNDVNALCCELVLPFEALGTITEKHIKKVLANKMVDVIADKMEIEHTTDNYKRLKIYKAKLKVKGVVIW